MKILAVITIVLIAACSANQVKLHSQLLPSNSFLAYELKDDVTVKASNAKASVLRAGTKWNLVGTIEQGSVYRTEDQVVIVNSFNVHEGYIVVKDSQVVGYYLPVEGTFIESKPIPINFIKMENTNEI